MGPSRFLAACLAVAVSVRDRIVGILVAHQRLDGDAARTVGVLDRAALSWAVTEPFTRFIGDNGGRASYSLLPRIFP